MNEPHPLLIERVASGNASIDDEQMLLVACETHPELYRELALAMLEERHFANGMRQLFAAPIVNADTVELPKLPQQNMTEQGRGAPSAKKSIAGWMLAAAAMFVGVTGGFASGWLSRQLGDDSTTGTSSEIALQNNPQEQVFGPRVPPTNLANQTTSPFGPGSRNRADPGSALPGFSNDFAASLLPRSLIPDELRSNLRQAGFHVEDSPEFYWVSDTDGSQWLVPSQATTVRYDGPR